MALDHGHVGEHVLRSVEALEPNIPWDIKFLKIRSACYTKFQHPLAADAKTDLVDFLAAEPGGLESVSPARIESHTRVVSAAK
jgi:hypothetical protein